MYHQSDVAILPGGEIPKRSDDQVLLPESVDVFRVFAHAHHELNVVDDDVADVVYVGGVFDRLRTECELLHQNIRANVINIHLHNGFDRLLAVKGQEVDG